MKKEEKSSLGFIDMTWEFFISLRLTVVLLFTLAATSIIGTLIPQNESREAYIQAFGEFWYRVFYVLDIFDMYYSWWFQLLLLLLTANIVACSIDRLSSLWKIIFVKYPPFRPGMFRKGSLKEDFTIDRPADQLRSTYETVIGKSFRYSRTEPLENGYVIYGEKGRLTRLGVYIVHLSVVLLLVGGIIGSLFGFDGFVNIPEGESARVIQIRNSSQTHPLDFEIRCEDFDVSFYQTGAPKEYRSRLVILEGGEPVIEKDIVVNDPLRYRGINIFQSSYGQVPPDVRTLQEAGVELSFTSLESGMVYTRKIQMNRPAPLPEGRGEIVLKNFQPSYLFMGQRDIGPTLVGAITPSEGEPAELVLPLQFPNFDRMMTQMKEGRRFVITVQGFPQRYYTGLQVTRDPGVPVVYLGFVFMILGCFVTFFMSHQRISVEVTAKGKKTSRVIVSGNTNKNTIGMEKQVRRLSRTLHGVAPAGPIPPRAGEIG